MTPRLSLHGQWRRTIAGALADFVAVPGSYRPVGECDLERAFTLPPDWRDRPGRYFLCTDGVLTTARFTVNGEAIGEAGPWTSYRFELSPGLLRAENTLRANVRDIVEPIGPVTGRRFDGGLIRDIYLERRPSAWIAGVSFRALLNDSCTAADCVVTVELDGPHDGLAQVELAERETGRVVASVAADPHSPIRFRVEWPRLWSPDMPNLYVLTVTLPGDDPDHHREFVGFRRIEVRGRDFYLNNRRLLLKGVCRHEFTSASGYSPSEAEVRRELALIKHAGFNYVRLVHSPHGPLVPRIAAEIGLLVSEEPGMSWEDLGRENIAALGLDTLRRTVLRDRNVPSVFAWMIYNECNPNTAYAVRASEMCRQLDPDRLLSMADCSGKDDAIRHMVEAANLSYYGINRYGYDPEGYLLRMETFSDRPLVFTEWGGWLALGNPRVMSLLASNFVRHSREMEPLRIAGCSFWAWADYEEFSRPGPAAIVGWTVEGLLDQRGNPRPDLQALSLMCFEMGQPQVRRIPRVEVLAQQPARCDDWHAVVLDAVEGDQSELERRIDAMRQDYECELPELGELVVAGIPFSCRPAQPLLLGSGRDSIFIPVDREVSRVAVLGHVDLTGGFPRPRVNQLGQPASAYVFEFEDGVVEQPLLHGVHVLRGNLMTPDGRGWKTAPRSSDTTPALQVELNPGFEVLRVDLWEKTFDAPRRLAAIRWRLADPASVQAMFALSVA